MLNIVLASSYYIDWISNSLSQYYKELNRVNGFEKYRTEVEIMSKHVSKRILDPQSEFKYFVAEDENGDTLGFISIFVTRVPEILVIRAGSNTDEKGVINSLMTFTIDYLKGLGYKQFISEVSEIDEFAGIVINSFDSRKLETTYVTQI